MRSRQVNRSPDQAVPQFFRPSREVKPRPSKSIDRPQLSSPWQPQRARSEQKGQFSTIQADLLRDLKQQDAPRSQENLKFITNNYYIKNFKVHQTSNLPRNAISMQSKLRPLNQTRGISVTLDLESRAKHPVKNNHSVDLHDNHRKNAEDLRQLLKNQTHKNKKLWATYLNNTKTGAIYPKQGSVEQMKKITVSQEIKHRSYQSLNIQNSDRTSTLTMTYLARTRQGALASNPNKVNQDALICQYNLCRSPQLHLFGVCDGHGQVGHYVSNFVKQYLPSVLITDPQLNKSVKNALIKSISIVATQANRGQFDTQFSGTTLNCVLMLEGGKLICANVGDSRAVIGRESASRYKAIPLSIDHKPSLPLEYQRIAKAGGRVESYYDSDGNPIGPQRVWVGSANYPGLAMSRSIGDMVAASVGVSDKPEIFEYSLLPEDKFMIIASDGVWEFLDSKQVVDLVGKFYRANDLEGACNELMKTSHVMWTREDDSVIDDISFIIVFFKHSEGINFSYQL